jgi:transposase-like protein
MSDTQDTQDHDQTMFTADQKLKLTQLISEGCAVLQEVETLNEGLADTVKHIAEELNIKSSVLKKAIRTAHKTNFGETQRDHELLENILVTVGKTL